MKRRGEPSPNTGIAIRNLPTRQDGRHDRRAPDLTIAALAAFLVLVLCSFSVHAGSDAATQLFQTGRTAFEAQNYAKALEAFEAALAAGLTGPAVHFNIGVAAFRAGDYSRAESAFIETARTPAMAALAHYNLGLVALRRADESAASRWFSLAEKEATDDRLRELAATRLAGLTPPPARNWVGYGAAAAGYDDNVALIANSDVLGVSNTADSFAELQLAATAPLDGPWRFDAGLFLLDYMDLDQFDQLGLQGGGRYRFDLLGWDAEAGLQLGYTTLNGKSFENLQMLTLQAGTPLLADWQLRARYRFSNIDGMNEFSGLTGPRHDLGIKFEWRGAPWRFGIEYQFETSDYDDESLSSTQQQLGAVLEREVVDGWNVALEALRRHTRYDVASNGVEDRNELSLSVTKSLTSRWRLVMRYSYADNNADQPLYDYNRNRIAAGVEAVL